MPRLNELAKAIHALDDQIASNRNISMLIYGDPKAGKSYLAATVAKLPETRNVWLFDTENGSDTIVTMVRDGALTEEEAAKITIVKIADLPEQAVAIDTILKCIVEGDKKPRRLCAAHGRVECPECIKNKVDQWDIFDLMKLTNHDWVIIDTASQVGISALNYATKGFEYTQKPGFDEYGMVSRMINDIGVTIQAAKYCNFICVHHQLLFEEKDLDKKLASEKMLEERYSKIYPMMGTRNTSVTWAKFFNTVIYVEKVLRAHKAGSSSTYKSDVITGSRIGMRIEDAEKTDLRYAFAKAGLTAWKPPATADKK